MPQLDLTWFIINFLVAWILVIIVLTLLLKQNFEITSNSNNITEENPSTINKNTQWLW